MLKHYSVSGYRGINDEISFSMASNNRIKKLRDHVIESEKSSDNLVKSAIIYGPNNTGKSVFIDSISTFKKITLSGNIDYIQKDYLHFNLFNKSNTISYDLVFLDGDTNYNYGFKINRTDGIIDEYLHENNKCIMSRATKEGTKEIIKLCHDMEHLNDKLFLHLFPKDHIKYKDIVIDFLKKLIILDYKSEEDENLKTTIDLLTDGKYKQEFIKLLKNSDVHIKDVFLKENLSDLKLPDDVPSKLIDIIKLTTVYNHNDKTINVPSILIDSLGTKKMMIYAGYIIKAIRENYILIIDKIDNSWHTFITKNILALFNNVNNHKAQLIATTHDLMLLDNRFSLRKDQIWFMHKDDEGNYLYSLDDFNDNDEINSRGSALQKYLKGMFGSLPYPNMIIDNINESDDENHIGDVNAKL